MVIAGGGHVIGDFAGDLGDVEDAVLRPPIVRPGEGVARGGAQAQLADAREQASGLWERVVPVHEIHREVKVRVAGRAQAAGAAVAERIWTL